jgi:hypothetical protein
MSWPANVRLEGKRLTPPVSPVPDKSAVWGLPEASSLTESEALRVPPALGVKVTLIAQFEPAATLVPQLFVWAKSPLLMPLIPMLEMFSVALPVLDSVTA